MQGVFTPRRIAVCLVALFVLYNVYNLFSFAFMEDDLPQPTESHRFIDKLIIGSNVVLLFGLSVVVIYLLYLNRKKRAGSSRIIPSDDIRKHLNSKMT